MDARIFLLSVCLGTAAAAPAEIYTAQPFNVISELIAAGEIISHVTISTAKL